MTENGVEKNELAGTGEVMTGDALGHQAITSRREAEEVRSDT